MYDQYTVPSSLFLIPYTENACTVASRSPSLLIQNRVRPDLVGDLGHSGMTFTSMSTDTTGATLHQSYRY